VTKKQLSKTITLMQLKSGAGRGKDQIGTLVGLGLNKVNRKVQLQDTPAIRGMISKVAHLIQIIN
jgi:large subunit ribosomal protein L30